MSIFNQSVDPNIKAQLERRQEAMVNRKPKDIQYINSRNSWIRMSSAVDTYKSTAPYPPTLDNLKDDANYDNSLAKKYILHGGVLNENGTLKSGVGNALNAYSGVSAEGEPYRLGIRPMPGITDIEVKSKGAYGSLRTVSVNFQCWDIKQLEDLELLYMRPGYTVLIEWGWCPYLDANGNIATTVEFYDIVNAKKTKETIWKELDAKMKVDGNYEAMFGYVKNYSWKARMDGGYDCSTEIISLGEVIESLKVNYTPSTAMAAIETKGGIISPNLSKVSGGEVSQVVDKVKDAANTALKIISPAYLIGSAIYNAFQDTDKEKLMNAYNQNILAGLFWEMYQFAQKSDPGTEDGGEPIVVRDNAFGVDYTLFHKTINMNGENTDEKKEIGESDEQYYISLESVVNIINNYVLLRDKVANQPFAKLTVKDEKVTPNSTTGDGYLLALAHPLQVSIDPRVCLIKNKLWVEGMKVNVIAAPPVNNSSSNNTNTNNSSGANTGNTNNNNTNTGNTNTGTTGTATVDAILIGGLDDTYSSAYYSISKQLDIFKSGFGTNRNVKAFKYNEATATITSFISKNPNVPIVTFSAGCAQADEISNVSGVNKNKIYIVECWAKNGNANVTKAVANGVPAANVWYGPSSETGKGVVKGATATLNRTDHWSALKSIGNYVK